MSTVSALLTIGQRDLTKLLRDRPRLAVNLLFPVMLVAGLGNVLQSSVGRVTGLDAVTLTFTGVLAATLFQSAAAGMISIVEDRETDFSRELFVAPVSRLTLVAGKILGETVVALCQGILVVACGLLFGVSLSPGRLAALALPGLGCCLLGGAFGLATVAALPNQRSAMQVFQFLIIPQYVLAGVIAPLHALPAALNALTWLLPIRYCVDLTRSVAYAGTPGYHEAVTMSPVLAGGVLVGLTVVLLVAGTALFTYRERTR